MVLILVCLASLIAHASGQCVGKADVIIAIPGDAVVPFEEFDILEKYLIQLVNYWHVERQNFNIGLILYGRTPAEIAWPLPFKTRAQVNTRITMMSRRNLYETEVLGGNDVLAAVNSITSMLTLPSPGYNKEAMRKRTRKIGILFQYGTVPQSYAQEVFNAVIGARNLGIDMYQVNANGTGSESSAFETCRRYPMEKFVSGLDAAIADLGSSVCAELDPTEFIEYPICNPKRYTPVKEIPVTCAEGEITKDDPNNCAYYYRCVFGKAVHNECALNMIYDPRTFSCNYRETVDCYANVDLACPKKTGLFAHPASCKKFLNCFNNTPYVLACPPETLFDENGQGCVPKSMFTCPSYKLQ